METKYLIYDPRYLTDEDSAICHSVCDTVDEAIEEMDDYGDGCVIVETIFQNNEVVSESIIDPENFKK